MIGARALDRKQNSEVEGRVGEGDPLLLIVEFLLGVLLFLLDVV